MNAQTLLEKITTLIDDGAKDTEVEIHFQPRYPHALRVVSIRMLDHRLVIAVGTKNTQADERN